MNSKYTVSIVVPVFNESEAICELIDEITNIAERSGLDFEVVIVDDGSTDGSWAVIQEQARSDSRISGIRFRRNFGKAAALTAGFEVSNGQIVVQMDGDLQDDPSELPKFLAQLEQGYDAVNGWKLNRLDPWHKVVPSKIFNWMVGMITGLKLHDHNCGFKCYRRSVISKINVYGELHRFIPVMAHAQGYRVTEIPINHRPRQHGRSKYGVRRFYRGFLDLLTIKFLLGFGQRPQHLLGGLGLLAFGLGLLGLSYLAILWLLGERPIGDRPLLAYSAASLLLGFMMFAFGLIAELVVSQNVAGSKRYNIAEKTKFEPEVSRPPESAARV